MPSAICSEPIAAKAYPVSVTATMQRWMLLRVGSQLVSGSADLIGGGRHYAGSALTLPRGKAG